MQHFPRRHKNILQQSNITMVGFGVRVMMLFILTTCITVSQDQGVPFSLPSPYKVSFGYANDNFIIGNQINNFVGKRLFPELDDRVTTSFFMTVVVPDDNTQYRADLFYHVLTDRTTQYRTDLIAIRAAAAKDFGLFRARAGIGAFLTGNLGGANIQNSFHDVIGVKSVSLPYTSSKNGGVIISGRGEYFLVDRQSFNILPFVSFLYASNTIPNFVRSGFSFLFPLQNTHWSVSLGYTHRYRVSTAFTNIFGSALYAGIVGEVPLSEHYALAGWITQDQFGQKNDVHFGLTMSWTNGGVRQLMVKDINFP